MALSSRMPFALGKLEDQSFSCAYQPRTFFDLKLENQASLFVEIA